MDEKITNMQDASQAVEQKLKDYMNGDTVENPTNPNEVIKTNTELPDLGHVDDNKPVEVEEPFKTESGVIGENPTLVTPPVENPTPETPQEKAVTGVTEKTAAVTFDENIANADDHDDAFEETLKKTEEELDSAFGDLFGEMGENGGDNPIPPSEETKEPESDEVPPSEEDNTENEEKTEYNEDENYKEGSECDETPKSVSMANPSSYIEEKVDHYTTVDDTKLEETNAPVIESGVNGETKELPAENPTTDIVNKDNVDTGTVGAADGAEEIIQELEKLNIVADSINGETGSIGSGATPEPNGTVTSDTLAGTGSESEEIEVEEKTDESDEYREESTEEENKVEEETNEVNENTEEGNGETPNEIGDNSSEEATRMDPQPVIGDAGDTNNLESDVDLHGDEFEKSVEEFDKIIKIDSEDGKNLGEKYTSETNLITSTLDEAVAASEAARANIERDMAHMGFEAAMLGLNGTGMESATNPDTGFDNNGDILNSIFKDL